MPRMRKINPKALYFSQRQTNAMDLIESYPITTFAAPMGFGKTTFLREYAGRSRKKVFWYTVHCDDPDVLWKEVCGGLSQLFPSFDESIYGSGFPRDAEEQRLFLARLRKSISKDHEAVLILDSFDQAEKKEVCDLILKIVQEVNGRIHFIISSRTVLWGIRSLPVLRGIVAPFYTDFFILSEDDIQGYFKKCGIDIPRELAERLQLLTGGWFSLLQIYVFRYMEIGAPSINNDVSDIIKKLIDESLGGSAPGLLQLVAMDEEFTREELEFLSGRKLSDNEFDELIRSNSFVFFNYESGEYHMQRVLRAYYKELFEALPEKEQQSRYLQLSGWYQKKGSLYLARKYAFLAKDYKLLMELTIRDEQIGSRYEKAEEIQRYFTECQEEVLMLYPKAIIFYLERFYGFGNQALAEKALELLDKSLKEGKWTEKERYDLLYRRELCLALGAFNDIDEMIAHYKEAGRYVGRVEKKRRISLSSAAGSTVLLSLFYQGGSMEETCRKIREMENVCNAVTDNSFLGYGNLAAAEAAYFSCKYSKSKILVEQALMECRDQKNWSTELCALHLKVKISISEGNIEEAQEYQVRMRSIVNDYCERDTQLARVVDLCECFMNIKMNREWESAPWLREGRFFSEEILPSTAMNIYSTYQGLLLASEKYAMVISLDNMLQNQVGTKLDRIHKIYSLIHVSAAYDALGFTKDAVEKMKEAMMLALPDQVYVPFAENSRITARIFDEVRKEDPELMKDLERVIEDYNYSLRRGNAVYNGPSIVNLTKREYKIAGMAAEGATNKEIAEELNLSVNTIKDALKVIYRKLAIGSRRELSEKLKEIRIET